MSAGLSDARAHRLAAIMEAAHKGLLIMARANRDVAAMMTVAQELETVLQATLSDPEIR